MSDHTNLDQLIDQIYGGALQPDGWTGLLQTLASFMNANSSILILDDMVSPGIPQSYMEIDPVWLARWESDYCTQDYRLQRVRCFPQGRVVCDDDLISRAAARKTAFYNEFLVPADTAHTMGASLLNCADLFCAIALNRSKKIGPFEEKERSVIRRLGPHFQRALHMSRQLSGANFQKHAACVALDKLDVGIVLVSSTGQAIFVNKAATMIFRAQDGLGFSRGQLDILDSEAAAKVRRATRDSRRISTIEAQPSQEIFIAVPRRSGNAPYQVLISRLHGTVAGTPFVESALCIMISDPTRLPRLYAQHLQDTYGATPAEARLAELLVRGSTLQDAAQRLGVELTTVRSQLKALFDKTGTNRQAELVRQLVLGRVAVAHRDDHGSA